MDSVESYLKPVEEFLSGTTSSPLSDVAHTFTQIVPDNVQFQVALNILLPITRTASNAEALRIQAVYLLWYIYRDHSLDVNPFKVAFQDLLREETSSYDSFPLSKPPEMPPFMLAVQAVLGGKGLDLAPYSPTALVSKWPLSTAPRPLIHTVRPESQDLGLDDTQIVEQLLRYASESVLSLSEQKVLVKLLPVLGIPPLTNQQEEGPPFPLGHLSKIVSNNPGTVAYHVMSRVISLSPSQCGEICWDILISLPPTLSSFDLWTRLLSNDTVLDTLKTTQETDENPKDSRKDTVASTSRKEALALFLAHCESTIDSMFAEERPVDGRNVEIDPEGPCGLVVLHFARFGLALVRSKGDARRGAWSIGMDEEEWFALTTVLQDFALRFVRFEAPCELYRALTSGGQREAELRS
ncbi:hypothetical protein FRC18_005219 [Serendipita sp. 400]|nr:hypothetical protein FRC18_005219 [Serendipita sp. 400]